MENMAQPEQVERGPFFEAHCHWQDPVLVRTRKTWRKEVFPGCAGRIVVNGTSPGDWSGVEDWVAREKEVIPFFGLHPWSVDQYRESDWESRLGGLLDRYPTAGVGEIGLDKWKRGLSWEAQCAAFAKQWILAVDKGRPLTVHCLQAFGHLQKQLGELPAAKKGFLLHAYSGPEELIPYFFEAGAYFSFSPYFCQEGKKEIRDRYGKIPADRLLVETDAPHMSPGPEDDPRGLRDEVTGQLLNHPANLDLALKGLAEIRGWTLEETRRRTWENGHRWLDLTPAIP